MTTRRAVSPVIATVILIAVAVALGIAVAVWAGALTGGLQKQEKLIINAYVSGANLVLSVTNQSPGSSTITQILFNQAPVTTFVAAPNGFTGTGWSGAPAALPATLTSAGTGNINMPSASLPTVPNSGITYPITVVTAAGNSYPSTITWP